MRFHCTGWISGVGAMMPGVTFQTCTLKHDEGQVSRGAYFTLSYHNKTWGDFMAMILMIRNHRMTGWAVLLSQARKQAEVSEATLDLEKAAGQGKQGNRTLKIGTGCLTDEQAQRRRPGAKSDKRRQTGKENWQRGWEHMAKSWVRLKVTCGLKIVLSFTASL